MKNKLTTFMISAAIMAASCSTSTQPTAEDTFEYSNERFADLQMLRYKVEGFEDLTLKQKTFIYYLQEAALS